MLDAARAPVSVWKSSSLPSAEAWQVYMDVLCRTYLPWTAGVESDDVFNACLTTRSISDAILGEVQLSPLLASRNAGDIAGSGAAGFYVQFVLAGAIAVEHRGERAVLAPGDASIMDSESPIAMQSHADRNATLTLFLPKDRFDNSKDAGDRLIKPCLPGRSLLGPAVHCLQHLAQSLRQGSDKDLGATTDALIALLPFALASNSPNQGASTNGALRRLIEFIRDNLSDSQLSPATAARHLSMSERYVHKLFAESGATFMSFVAQERLERIRLDISLPHNKKVPISAIAYRWGYNDLSTFSRAFKARFGYSPNMYRALR